jgi:hypothetical protein
MSRPAYRSLEEAWIDFLDHADLGPNSNTHLLRMLFFGGAAATVNLIAAGEAAAVQRDLKRFYAALAT